MGTQSPGSVRKTKRMLAEALVRLVEKRSFKKISVGDICREAMVSRSAFYGHFADKYELLTWCLREMLRVQQENRPGQTLEAQLVSLLEAVQENRRAIYNIFMADLSQELMDIFHNAFSSAVTERLEQLQRAGVRLSGPVELVAAFYAGGMAGVILSWVRENCATPREEVARCQCRLLAGLDIRDASFQNIAVGEVTLPSPSRQCCQLKA